MAFWMIVREPYRCYHLVKVGSVPIGGTMVRDVRPLMRPTKPTGLGAAAPILLWANSIGNQWVNDTVRSYRKGVK